jgi:hypothetical protein
MLLVSRPVSCLPLAAVVAGGMLLLLSLLWNNALAQPRRFTITYGSLTLSYTDPKDKAYVQRVRRVYDESMPRLRKIGLSIRAVHIIAAQNANDFYRLTNEGVKVAAIAMGQTIYTQRWGALATHGRLERTLRHELFHAMQPPLSRSFPLWLAEGLARIFSGEASGDPNTNLDPSTASHWATLSAGQLEAILGNRQHPQLSQAYAEASRRAQILLAARGWRGIWSGAP